MSHSIMLWHGFEQGCWPLCRAGCHTHAFRTSTCQIVQRSCTHLAGYFAAPDGSSNWSGVEGIRVGRRPDFGPDEPHPQLGICTIGAAPWITNFNVLLQDVDMATGALVVRITQWHCKPLGSVLSCKRRRVYILLAMFSCSCGCENATKTHMRGQVPDITT